MKIMDVSNSSKRPPHRGGGGPKQNEIVGYLKKYAILYGCSFVESAEEADCFFTNDVFPDFVLKTTKRKIKRMDGVFWNPALSYRNDVYNKAAEQADHVIFISEYAEKTFFTLYNIPLKKHTVILNKADSNIYKPTPLRKGVFTWVASATDWSREEKRLDSVIEFMHKRPSDYLFLIGKAEGIFKPNIVPFGYIQTPDIISEIMRQAHAMINFSYRDPAPKVVTQATACGLPILYADSGGTHELVGTGIGVKDEQDIIFEPKVPPINIAEAVDKALLIILNYNEYRIHALQARQQYGFREMLDQYFKILLDE